MIETRALTDPLQDGETVTLVFGWSQSKFYQLVVEQVRRRFTTYRVEGDGREALHHVEFAFCVEVAEHLLELIPQVKNWQGACVRRTGGELTPRMGKLLVEQFLKAQRDREKARERIERAPRKKAELALPPPEQLVREANTPDDWIDRQEWQQWEAPLNIPTGESNYTYHLLRLVGAPRPGGYLVPVEVDLAREPSNPFDQNAIRVQVRGYRVGYVPADIAVRVAPVMDLLHMKGFRLAGLLKGGDSESFNNVVGCQLWVHRRLTTGLDLLDFTKMKSIFRSTWPPESLSWSKCCVERAPLNVGTWTQEIPR